MPAHLAVVPSTARPHTADDSIAQRLRDLRDEARLLAREQVGQLREGLVGTAALAAEIAEGGEAYAVGAREFARRLAENLGQQAAMLTAIVERERH